MHDKCIWFKSCLLLHEKADSMIYRYNLRTLECYPFLLYVIALEGRSNDWPFDLLKIWPLNLTFWKPLSLFQTIYTLFFIPWNNSVIIVWVHGVNWLAFYLLTVWLFGIWPLTDFPNSFKLSLVEYLVSSLLLHQKQSIQ